MWILQKIIKSTKIGTLCFSSNVMNDAVLLKVTYTKKKKKKNYIHQDRLSKVFYWMVVNNGIPLKVTYTRKFFPT